MLTLPKFNGMTNKHAYDDIPDGKLGIAVNCQFTNSGKTLFPRPGKTRLYTGNVHSLFYDKNITLFSEGGSLKKLLVNNTSIILKTGIGSSKVFYTKVGDIVYWANELACGKIVAGVNKEWGCPRPPKQPQAIAIDSGGMNAGTYRVVITWLSYNQESGTGLSVSIDVLEGGGIHLMNFPIPDASVDGVCIYLSSVNSENMYLYGEFSKELTDISLIKHLGNVALLTQFLFKPDPKRSVCAHLGRIYYSSGSQLYYTEPYAYGLQKANNYFNFSSEIKTIVSLPPFLFVGTKIETYKISNIDGVDGSVPSIDALQITASVLGSECYDTDGKSAYCLTDRGFTRYSVDGTVTDISFDDCALPMYEEGTMQLTEENGLRYLTFVGKNQTTNKLAVTN